MAYEAVLYLETSLPVPMTCSNTTGIEKGALLKLSDPRTVAIVTADEDIVGGVAAAEKIASDGRTTIPVYRGGWFKSTASGSITVGDPVGIEGDTINTLKSLRSNTIVSLSGSRIWGIALETATTGETFLWELRPMALNGV